MFLRKSITTEIGYVIILRCCVTVFWLRSCLYENRRRPKIIALWSIWGLRVMKAVEKKSPMVPKVLRFQIHTTSFKHLLNLNFNRSFTKYQVQIQTNLLRTYFSYLVCRTYQYTKEIKANSIWWQYIKLLSTLKRGNSFHGVLHKNCHLLSKVETLILPPLYCTPTRKPNNI